MVSNTKGINSIVLDWPPLLLPLPLLLPPATAAAAVEQLTNGFIVNGRYQFTQATPSSLALSV